VKKFTASLLMAAMPVITWAGAIDRSGQGLGALFEQGRYVEASISHVSPRVRGSDLLGGATSDVAGNYLLPALSVKLDASDKLSLALVVDQPYGADILYGKGSLLLGGTRVDVSSYALLGLTRYRFTENFSAHAGLRVQNSSATVRLNGLAYGPVAGYEVKMASDTASGAVVGAAFEIPAIALRISATYHDAIKHRFDTRETAQLPPLNGTSTTEISTPRAVNLEFQTGIADSTLLFGRLRWVKWSEFRVDPALFFAVTGEGLIELKNTHTYTLGLARQFSDHWEGAVSIDYEQRGDPLSSPLAPVNGRKGLTVAAIYRWDRTKITAGMSY
jgi:long-chain fatty acid transport protein